MCLERMIEDVANFYGDKKTGYVPLWCLIECSEALASASSTLIVSTLLSDGQPRGKGRKARAAIPPLGLHTAELGFLRN